MTPTPGPRLLLTEKAGSFFVSALQEVPTPTPTPTSTTTPIQRKKKAYFDSDSGIFSSICFYRVRLQVLKKVPTSNLQSGLFGDLESESKSLNFSEAGFAFGVAQSSKVEVGVDKFGEAEVGVGIFLTIL